MIYQCMKLILNKQQYKIKFHRLLIIIIISQIGTMIFIRLAQVYDVIYNSMLTFRLELIDRKHMIIEHDDIRIEDTWVQINI